MTTRVKVRGGSAAAAAAAKSRAAVQKKKKKKKVGFQKVSRLLPQKKKKARTATGCAYLEGSVIPIVTADNRRKRDPRAGARRVRRKYLFPFGRGAADSTGEFNEEDASVTNSCDDKEQLVAEQGSSRAEDRVSEINVGKGNGSSVDNANERQGTPQRRGSLRLKVRPSKFRESVPPSVEKARVPGDPSHSPEVAASLRNQNVASRLGKDPRESSGKSTDKRQGKDGGSQNCEDSPKQSVAQKETQVPVAKKETQTQAPVAKKETQSQAPVAKKELETQVPVAKKETQAPVAKKETQAGTRESEKVAATYVPKEHSTQADNNDNELQTSLTVIKKIMRMEAAEPFNTPVDPVALGIPDYFDVIDNPIDFGTISQTLEKREKYRSSQDVYEDVQLIWTNCRKYNNKGDPILELLKRVKKNFMKYWTAAGLYSEKTAATVEQVIAECKSMEAKQQSEEADTTQCDTPLEAEAEDVNDRDAMDVDAKDSEDAESLQVMSGDNMDAAKNSKKKQRDMLEHQLKAIGETKIQEKVVDKHKVHKFVEKGTVQPETVLSVPNRNVGESEDESEKPASEEPSRSKKDSEAQSTPSKSRRVSGTGHHKSDCSCVVCTGVRRKLAREGKLITATEIVEEKSVTPIETEVGVVQEDVVGNHDSQLPMEINNSPIKVGTEEGTKGGTLDDMEEKEDNIQSEEHFAETLDVETERPEGGAVQYYRASYEIPLRKVNPSVLHMGQILFGGGPGSPWSGTHSLKYKPNRGCTENPLLTAATLFVGNKDHHMWREEA